MERRIDDQTGIRTSYSRYTRFEPVTVRAAARVLRLARSGAVEPWETDAYLQDLLDLDRFARGRNGDSLRRLARWRSRLSDAGAPRQNGRRRRAAVAAIEVSKRPDYLVQETKVKE